MNKANLNECQITDLGSLHKYRHEIPNIVDEALDLDPYEYRLYAKYKKIAGDNGRCFRSNTKLAAECNMSLTKLKEAKARLAEAFSALKGKPLIYVKQRITEDGDRDTDLINIVDIWPENMEYISQKNMGQFSGDQPQSPGNQGVSRHTTNGQSPGDYKEQTHKKNPTKNCSVFVPPDGRDSASPHAEKSAGCFGKKDSATEVQEPVNDVNESELYMLILKAKKDWTAEEIGYALDEMKKRSEKIHKPLAYIEGIIYNYRKANPKKPKKQTRKEKVCKTQAEEQPMQKQEIEVPGTLFKRLHAEGKLYG